MCSRTIKKLIVENTSVEKFSKQFQREISFYGLLIAMLFVAVSSSAAGYEKMENKSFLYVVDSDLNCVIDYQLGDTFEAKLEVEDWMLHPNEFVSEELSEGEESELVLESWMTDVMEFLLDEDR